MKPDAAIKKAAEALLAARRVTLACHLNPDGDALGSTLGLALALERSNREVVTLCQDAVPPAYGFLPGSDRMLTEPPHGWEPDVAVGLDCDTEPRLGAVAPFVLNAPVVIDIDHHTGSGPFGDIRVLDPTASSTSQQVFYLLRAMNIDLDRDIATCLLAGIMFDTGAFRFSNTSPETLEAGARLVEAGAQPHNIAREMFENRPFASLKLLGRALVGARVQDGIVWSVLTRRDFRETGAEESETDGIINHLMATRDVRAAVLLRETGHGVKASLRSRPPIDVAVVARAYGGGGHVLASGCTIDRPLDEAAKELIARILEQNGHREGGSPDS
jgi:phosphoesterase RecJ-like protein